LTKYFAKIKALDNLNLEIEKGELLGLIGSNGAGKTTAIRIICGILKPDQGDVLVGGYSVLKDPIMVKSMIGYLPEEPNLYERFKARDLLRYFGELYGVPAEGLDERVNELLKLVGMDKRAEHRINTFSKGLRQRIGIARALIHDPEIIIFDEPTMGLDPASALSIRNFIEDLKGEKTIILCTHYMDEADTLCDRVAILNRGKIRDIGTPNYLKQKIHGQTILQIKIRSNETDMDKINSFNSVENFDLKGNELLISLNSKDEISDIINYIGHNVVSVNTKEPTLEDVFIHTVK
ncbi:MAG: ABC transporter ATP-binding protein, partial [Methanobacterium sp.]